MAALDVMGAFLKVPYRTRETRLFQSLQISIPDTQLHRLIDLASLLEKRFLANGIQDADTLKVLKDHERLLWYVPWWLTCFVSPPPSCAVL